MKQAMLIVNPSSGEEKSKDYEIRAENKLKKSFDKVKVYHTQRDGDAILLCKKACKENFHSVFVMGGDGTVNEAINGLAEEKYIPKFGVFPLGTVNDLARALNISLDPIEAIENFDADSLIDLDVGKINEVYFINVAAIGILPESINDVESEDKTRLGKFAYYISVLKNLTNLETFKFKIIIDGKEEEIETSTILIGLTNSVGGFETLFPEAKVNDGALNFLAIKGKNLLDTVKSVPDLLRGVDSSTENIRYTKFKNGSIEQLDGQSILAVNIDGDQGPVLPVKVKVLPCHIQAYYCKM